ncbi:MAG: amidase, partial [Chloroflexota bacterium]|nr:amidase [Chloroflexota bacterium]
MDNLNSLTISTALEALRQNKISPQDLTSAGLRKIERLNPTLKAFITVIESHPETYANGGKENTPSPRSPSARSMALNGIPIAVKDLFNTAGVRTTAGSKFFADHIPETDAFVVGKLKEAGALILGKTNTHEIALGVTGNNPHYGTACNPWDITRIPGGSSSGSAIAVATGMVLGALGTDTGGSIRIPASLCGVVGFKPTYGRVSLRGVFPLSWNLD